MRGSRVCVCVKPAALSPALPGSVQSGCVAFCCWPPPPPPAPLQYIGAIGKGNTNFFWTEVSWMYEFTQAFIAAKSKPAVFSMSYAWSEIRQCQDIDPSECSTLGVTSQGYVERTNIEFQKIGVLGTTLLSASGDSGCHGRTNEDCITSQKCFPDYPACSPFVTAVGGTQLENGVSNGATRCGIVVGGWWWWCCCCCC